MVIIVVVALLALLLAVYIIVKKRFSHFPQVDPNAEPLGAAATGENSSVSVSFGLVVFLYKKRFS